MKVLIDENRYYVTSATIGGIEGAIEVPTIPNTNNSLKDICHKLDVDNETWVFDEPKYLTLMESQVPSVSLEDQVKELQDKNLVLTNTIDTILTEIIPSLQA